MEFISPEEMARAELDGVNRGLTVEKLMEAAGRGVAEAIMTKFIPIEEGKSVVIVCGSGNNGGDGFVIARYLRRRFEVAVLLLASPDRIRTPEARANWERLGEEGGGEERVARYVADTRELVLSHATLLSRADLIVDAILGTGVKEGEVREPLASAIALINRSGGKKVAVDIPSGLDPGTGNPGSAVVRADVTMTLHRAKVGLRGRAEYTGELVLIPLGLG